MAVTLDEPLDMSGADAAGFLQSIQGNILKAHARDHAQHLLVRFSGDAAANRTWVANFASGTLTTGAVQHEQIEAFKKGEDSGTFTMMALSNAGFDALGIAASKPQDPIFLGGLKNSRLTATDPPVMQWEQPYQGDIHAIIIVADNNAKRLLEVAVPAIETALKSLGAVVHGERGEAIVVNDPVYGRQNLVHFGFADGLSQPEAVKKDIAAEVERNGGDAFWSPGAPLSLLFQADAGGYGSYLVFRKLEQNVRGFYEAERAVATALGLQGADAARVEAMIVGRRRNGEPAIGQPPAGKATPGNNFNFDGDRFGVLCPFHAHIRRTNPRGDLSSPGIQRPALSLEVERGFRIARRGIPYGSAEYMAKTDFSEYPQSGVGLLFLSFQSRLRNFEIQQDGSDSGDFPMPGVGVDATIGRSQQPTPQHWYLPQDAQTPPGPDVSPAGELRFAFANFVTLKGGEYFYAPSPGFLRNLAP